MLTADKQALLLRGTVIPAHPLALEKDRTLDEYHQRLLTRYYLAAGVGGIAVGVHTTQFAIRDPAIKLFERVLALAAEEVEQAELKRPMLKIAGVTGATDQACREAKLAKQLGYDLVLLSTNGLGDWSESALLERAQAVGEVLPLFGFYLQPAVGGRVLSRSFWEAFAEIEAVLAIKIAPFNRYQTLDVVQAICSSKRHADIALYTGNDDNIVLDLLSTFELESSQGLVKKDIVGGLLGHWAVWTHQAVDLLDRIHAVKSGDAVFSAQWLTEALQVTDTNAAFFDAANQFKGCIAGLHEVLQRQGLMKGIWCLDPAEGLSPGQQEEIDRVYAAYPHLHDDVFVKQFLENSSS
ncbi:MAG: hypothetical protein KTR30_05420 [Saprospiraceae bacterium]|nr:hypothetical protein [Saprospiraceae bacterium]